MTALARRRLELLSAELADLRDSVAPSAEGPSTVATDPVTGAAGEEEAAEPAGPERVAAPGRHARRPVGLPGRIGGWMHDRLPPTLQGRVRLTGGHLTVVALMVAGALAVTAWWVVRAEGSTTVVPAAAPAATSTGQPVPGAAPPPLVTPGALPGAATPATPGTDPTGEPAVVVVDVAGKVRRPGIASLPLGSRVVDALEAAGGARPGVDLIGLNLARILVDGEQIVVGVPPPGGVAAPAASAPDAPAPAGGSLVNINTADQPQLEELPGVGPVTAAAILQWRTENGPFTAVDELMEVSGIGEATLAEIAPHVTL